MRHALALLLGTLVVAGCAHVPTQSPLLERSAAFSAADDAPVSTASGSVDPNAPTRGPVLLVHGHGGTAADWSTIQPWLQSEGFQPKSFTFVTQDWRIDDLAEQVAAEVDALCKESHQDKIDVVAHSIGGLAVRYYMKYDHGDQHIRHLVMLATPNHGIWLSAPGIWIPVARELRPHNPLLDELNSPQEVMPGVSTTCIWSTDDWTEWLPFGGGALKGAFNYETHGVTHPGMLTATKLFPTIEAGLLRPMDARPGPQQMI